MPKSGNCFADLPERLAEEAVTTLASFAGARIERIVSTGQASPPGFWYDQDGPEWVILLAGSAGLLFEGEDELRVLASRRLCRDPAKGPASRRMDRCEPSDGVAGGSWRDFRRACWKMNPCSEQAKCASSLNPP